MSIKSFVISLRKYLRVAIFLWNVVRCLCWVVEFLAEVC